MVGITAEPKYIEPNAPGMGPAEVQVSQQIFEGLVRTGDDGSIEPVLATDWTISDDGLTYTFNLVQGVKFSNGEDVETSDWVWSFYRARDYETSNYRYIAEAIDTVEATDEQVVITLTEPNAAFLAELGCFNMVLGDQSYAESMSDEEYLKNPIGTGPYVVTENVLGQYCVIERNDNYWGTPGIAKTFRFKVIPDAETRYTALRAGEVQGLCDLGAISPSQAAEIDGDPAYNVSVGDSGITHFLNVNGGAFPFNDVRMREGLSLLLDRQTIIDSFYNGYGLAAGGFLNYTSAFYREQPVQHDPERGAELIREVVGDQEVELLFLLPGVDANRYPYQEEAEYIQSLLENIEGTHIKVSIQQMDWGPCKEEMEAGNYNLCLKIQGLPSANPFSLFKGFMHTEGGTNISYGLGYHNDHVDELIEEAAACLDAGRLTEIYTELQEISAVDFPNIPVLYSQEVVASSSDITGYQATVYGLTGFTQVCWAE